MNKRALLAIMLCLLLGLAACTGPGDDEPTPTPVPLITPAPLEDTAEPEETAAPEEEEESEPIATEAADDDPAATDEGADDPSEPADDDMTRDGEPSDVTDLADEGGEEEPTTLAAAADENVIVITPGPDETPILVDPIDKPTIEPAVLAYKNYSFDSLKISFDVPMLWSMYKPGESSVQFIEPEESAVNGYRAQLTVVGYGYGAEQNAADADVKLREIMEVELAGMSWENYKFNGDTASASMAGGKGYYAYFTADYNGVGLRGRVMVIAKGASLYQVRISSVRERYSAYEDIYRQVRNTWKFQ